MEKQINRDIKNSNYDGIFAHMFATLTGGVFLTGFAVHLGMNEMMIGLLASMPFIVTVFQLPVSLFIWKNGRRKKIVYLSAFLARIIWVPIIIFAVLPITSSYNRSQVILGLIFFSYTFASVSYVSWLSWISDLIPDKIRGNFFGTRNMLCGAAGMIVMLIFGKMLDGLNNQSIGVLPIGFTVTFVSAVFFGIGSLFFLKKMSEPLQIEREIKKDSFLKLLSLPMSESNFKKFLIFAFLWSFSVHFASPFFTLYFLRDLKFSYTFVAVLGTLSAFADLTGMKIWGRISDRVKNKAVIQFASWVAIFLPLAWVTVKPDSFLMPIILHIIGGGFWAGINLCMVNLLLRLSPEENKAVFLSIYNIAGGVGAATGPILAGLVLTSIAHLDFHIFTWKVHPLQIIFLTSSLFRLLSFQIFKLVQEPEESSAKEIIRILRSMRGMNITNGFNYLLHPFAVVEKEERD